MKDKKFLALSSLFFLLFIGAMSTILMSRPTSQILRAKNSVPSPLKSFVIVFPQVGVAGSDTSINKPTKIKVSVFMRDVNGNLLPGRTIRLSSNPPNINIIPSDTLTTDNIGQAQFFITSETTGKIQLIASDTVTSTNIASVPTVEFTQ